MYRSPLLLFYFLRNRITMFSRHLIAACCFTTFIGTLFCLPLAAIAQTSDLQTSDLQASGSPTVPLGAVIRGYPFAIRQS